jgi:hypothetical protein
VIAQATPGDSSSIEARHGASVLWQAHLPGWGGPIARAGTVVIATSSVTGAGDVRGEPGGVVTSYSAATGKVNWYMSVGSSEWLIISAVAGAPDGSFVVGGTFSGTLRASHKLVSSAGRADGFVMRVTPEGDVAWLERVGGPGADAILGVALSGDRVAIAGTFAQGADLLGTPLSVFDERSPFGDGFVAVLDAKGARVWSQTFGGRMDDAVAGVAIDTTGRVVVAATARNTVHVGAQDQSGGTDLTVQGASDGLVAWWSPTGDPGASVLVGGGDQDGLRGIVAVGDRVVVSGYYAGKIQLGAKALTAGGGDDAFVAELAADGKVVGAWQAGGDGREEITALAAVPGGFIAGVSHTARALLDGVALPAPADPLSGAALMIRPL